MLTPVPVPSQAIHSRAGLNLHYSDIQSTAQKSPCVNTFLRPLLKKKKKTRFVNLGAWAGHQRTRHRGVRHDGVPVLHVEPIRARLRQELEQDDDEVVTPRPETQHRGHEQKQKRKFGQKGRLTKEKNEEGTFYYRNISGEGIFFITVLIKSKKIAAGENYSHYSFILIRKQ